MSQKLNRCLSLGVSFLMSQPYFCHRIASAARSDCVRCPIGLRSVSDERVWGGIHQKYHFYSLFPIHLGSTTVPITRNG